MAEEKETGNALFYRDPQPVTVAAHGNWRLKDGDLSYAKDALGVPLVIGEFVDAARFYPIVFAAGDQAGAIALTSIDTGNLFLKDGRWDDQAYIPAYIRRHPFILIGMPNGEQQNLALGIDAGSPRWTQDPNEGVPLFDGEKPTDMTTSAMNFCSAYTVEADHTATFVKALRDKGLLEDRQLDCTLPGDKKYTINGFQTIDAKKLTDMDSETIVEWHRKGWMAACYAHLQSHGRVNDLLNRRAGQSAA
jgi:SapC